MSVFLSISSVTTQVFLFEVIRLKSSLKKPIAFLKQVFFFIKIRLVNSPVTSVVLPLVNFFHPVNAPDITGASTGQSSQDSNI